LTAWLLLGLLWLLRLLLLRRSHTISFHLLDVLKQNDGIEVFSWCALDESNHGDGFIHLTLFPSFQNADWLGDAVELNE
jgi:hypothetical protein